MRRLSLHAVIALLAVIALSVTGCGGDNPLRPASRATPTPAATPAAPPSAAPSIAAPPPTGAPPTSAPPTSAASAAVTGLELRATGSAEVPQGGRVALAFTFTLVGQPLTVETTLAWRVRGGELQYGQFNSFNAAPGANAQDMGFGVGGTTQVGTSFEVFGAIKASGQTYLTQSPVVIGVLAAPASVTPAGPSPQPTPAAEPTPTLPIARPTPTDARSAQIKSALEGKGFRVLEVGFVPAKDGNPPILGAIVEADYAQASGEAVLRQAFGVWDVLFNSLTMDSPDVAATLLVAGERWTKYLLYLAIRAEEAANHLKSLQAASSDEQKQEALQTLLRAIRFSVFDTERQEYVDQKDFTNKNFTQ